MASDQTDEQVLEAIWRSPDTSAPFFSALFLQQIPAGQLGSFLGGMIEQCGELITIQKTSKTGEYGMVTDRCEIPTVIARNADGKVGRLSLYQPVRRHASLDDLLRDIKAFDGSVSYAIFENGDQITGHDTDRPMAVGSAFKLIVLAAIRDLVEERKAGWADVVTLKKKHVSLPSGDLHRMPIGSPYTLHTLAAAMIAESDNTATDVLIDVIGRDRLEAMSGLKPFLTTREFFLLKADEGVYERYEQADQSGRKAILEGLADAPLPPARTALTPWKPEAEWLLSTKALCGWIEKVADLEIAQITTGPIRRTGWKHVSYKGGSEIGVLNYTTHARDDQDRDFCVSITWNADQMIDPEPLNSLYAAVMHALKKRP
ncbi:MAG: serine hydrolase [Geminicoccaceae bacterium]